TLVSPSHTYSAAGPYSVTLIVANSYNCYDTIKKGVTVNNLPNVFWNYSRLCTGSALQINFKDSSNIALPDLLSGCTYQWDLAGLGAPTIPNPTQIFNFPGTYNITLMITSAAG